jgi:hypothetical protein
MKAEEIREYHYDFVKREFDYLFQKLRRDFNINIEIETEIDCENHKHVIIKTSGSEFGHLETAWNAYAHENDIRDSNERLFEIGDTIQLGKKEYIIVGWKTSKRKYKVTAREKQNNKTWNLQLNYVKRCAKLM